MSYSYKKIEDSYNKIEDSLIDPHRFPFIMFGVPVKVSFQSRLVIRTIHIADAIALAWRY